MRISDLSSDVCSSDLQVAAVAFAFSVPEVVLAATYHGGQRGERRNVPAQIAAVGRVVAVGLDDHGHGVPAYIRAYALFQYDIARMRRLEPWRYGIDVGGIRRKRNVGARTARKVDRTRTRLKSRH